MVDNQEYRQKMRECWEEFLQKHEISTADGVTADAFIMAFDRAYAPDEMKQAAEDYEWREVNGRLLCPKCLEECCDYNPQTYEFTEKTRSSEIPNN